MVKRSCPVSLFLLELEESPTAPQHLSNVHGFPRDKRVELKGSALFVPEARGHKASTAGHRSSAPRHLWC